MFLLCPSVAKTLAVFRCELLLRRVIRGLLAFGVAAEAEHRGLIGADDVDFGFLGDLVFHTE